MLSLLHVLWIGVILQETWDSIPRVCVDAGVIGLTKFLRTRKPIGDTPSSWWPAKPGPSLSARVAKRQDNNNINTGNKDQDNKEELPISLGQRKNISSGTKFSSTGAGAGVTQGSSYAEIGSPYRVDHVCIDMNQLLHGSFRTSSDPRHCIAKIFVGLDNILRLVEPTKSLVLTFDGPG